MIKKHARPANGNASQNRMAMTIMPIYCKQGITRLCRYFLRMRKSVAPCDIPIRMIAVMSISSGICSGVVFICRDKNKHAIQNKKASLCNILFFSGMFFCLLIIRFLAGGGLR